MCFESRETCFVKVLWQLLDQVGRRDGNGQIGSRHFAPYEPFRIQSSFKPFKGRINLTFEPVYPFRILRAWTTAGELYGALINLFSKTDSDSFIAKHLSPKRLIVWCETAVGRYSLLQIFDDCPAIVEMFTPGQDKGWNLSKRIYIKHFVKNLERQKECGVQTACRSDLVLWRPDEQKVSRIDQPRSWQNPPRISGYHRYSARGCLRHARVSASFLHGLGVEGVLQAVAQEIEGNHGDEDEDARIEGK